MGGGLTVCCSILAFSSREGTLSLLGGAPTLAISYSRLRVAFIRVFIIHIITTIGLDAQAHHKYTLMARYKISKKMRVS